MNNLSQTIAPWITTFAFTSVVHILVAFAEEETCFPPAWGRLLAINTRCLRTLGYIFYIHLLFTFKKEHHMISRVYWADRSKEECVSYLKKENNITIINFIHISPPRHCHCMWLIFYASIYNNLWSIKHSVIIYTGIDLNECQAKGNRNLYTCLSLWTFKHNLALWAYKHITINIRPKPLGVLQQWHTLATKYEHL